MCRRVHLAFAGVLFLLACFCGQAAHAQTERILSYHSDITLHEDASLTVTETIRVFAAGNQIRHGIYRDFPTSYKDMLTNSFNVGFRFLGATRDGQPEQARIEDLSNGKRIYLGDAGSFVPRGEHTYTITYFTDRQLGFFKDHDELFWNVTGNGWIFSIDEASATVHLPSNVPADSVQLDGYTGLRGSREKALTESKDEKGMEFTATRTLRSREGLSILLNFPKGYFLAPTFQQKFQRFLDDNPDAGFLGLGVLLLVLYYYLVWSAVGRDPKKGVIMPLYEPPSDFSPAATRYLYHMRYDNKTFTAAILDMAVRGYLIIKEQAGSYTLYRTKADNRVLTPDEQQIANLLFDGRDQIWLHNENHTTISSAIKGLKSWLKVAEQKVYFVTNGRYSIPAIVFTVLLLVVIILRQGGPKIVMAAFLCVWLTIWSFAVIGLLVGAGQAWKAAFKNSPSKPGDFVKAFFLTVISLPFLAGEVFGMFLFSKITSLAVTLSLLFMVLIHFVFHFLLKAPTRAGRSVLDRIDGFKMFLGAVDGDRLNRVMPPNQTPATFEKFLPYALALGVEQQWAEKFSGILGAAAIAPGSSNGSGYSPAWYSGGNFSSLGAAGFASSLGGSFSSAISSSAAAPGSSGGGGGGSGGGGGGGGGGGW